MSNDNMLEMADAAKMGDLERLYMLIQKDQFILEHIDATPFIDTPLHIVASASDDPTHLRFATEIMRLKPSFVLKLNQQGFSPIHLALQHDHKKMVCRFVDINKEMVRVKGKEGLTPLHYASQNGDIALLDKLLMVCPDSIEDLTVRSETALHLAMKYQQCEALKFLLEWLRVKNPKDNAWFIERFILNWKDDTGNTMLHISTLNEDKQVLDLLINTPRIELNSKNLENLTALDIAVSDDIKRKLIRAGAMSGLPLVQADCNLAVRRFFISLRNVLEMQVEMITLLISGVRENMSDSQRSNYLVVVALFIAAIYQSVVSPPGGVFQAEANSGFNNFNATSVQGDVGKSIMSSTVFNSLFSINTFILFLAISILFVVMPAGTVGAQLVMASLLLAVSFLHSVLVISPPGSVYFFKTMSVVCALLFLFLGLPSILATFQISRFFALVLERNRSRRSLLMRY